MAEKKDLAGHGSAVKMTLNGDANISKEKKEGRKENSRVHIPSDDLRQQGFFFEETNAYVSGAKKNQE